MKPSLLARLAHWLGLSTVRPPAALTGPQWSGPSFVDAYRRQRPPTPGELLGELKNAAWACATLNAGTCASYPPRLYVATRPGQPQARCLTRALRPRDEARLRDSPHLAVHTRAAQRVEEVTQHPLLDLLRQANPVHNAFDLWELTALYQEVLGAAYWYLEPGPLGVPVAVWPLPAHNVTPRREPDSPNLVDSYAYRLHSAKRLMPRW